MTSGSPPSNLPVPAMARPLGRLVVSPTVREALARLTAQAWATSGVVHPESVWPSQQGHGTFERHFESRWVDVQ